jgi:hypothetical protein
MNEYEKLLWETSKVACPKVSEDHPRRASDQYKFQGQVNSRYSLVTNLLDAVDAGKDGFVSTYSFPRGHTDDGNNIPEIDTIFVDFDIPSDSEYRKDGYTFDAWKRSISDLLIRVQMVADTLIESGKAKHWRASLSGHKGVHLFLDFEPIDHNNGSYDDFRSGLGKYGDEMIEQLDEISGGINIGPWVDVDSSDLARLVRHPNTKHPGAQHVDESWCVPVTLEELSEMTPDRYLELTSGPRELPDGYERVPSKEVTDEIAVEYIRQATESSYSPRDASSPSVKDQSKVDSYKENSNDRINVSDVPFLIGKPCIMAFMERDDAYQHGHQSRVMEIQIMKELIQKEVPIDVIVNFFRPLDGWNEQKTRDLVVDLISRYDGPFVCQNIWDQAPEFCVAMDEDSDIDCSIYDSRNETT